MKDAERSSSGLRSRVQSNDNWLKYSENLYREEQKRIGAYARECRAFEPGTQRTRQAIPPPSP